MISSTIEKQGGGQIDLGTIYDFQHYISRKGLIDVGYQGENFTWCNNRRGRAHILERLDRVLINMQLQTMYTSLVVHHFPRITSDHSPLLIKLEGDIPKVSSGFIFQRMWTGTRIFSVSLVRAGINLCMALRVWCFIKKLPGCDDS